MLSFRNQTPMMGKRKCTDEDKKLIKNLKKVRVSSPVEGIPYGQATMTPSTSTDTLSSSSSATPSSSNFLSAVAHNSFHTRVENQQILSHQTAATSQIHYQHNPLLMHSGSITTRKEFHDHALMQQTNQNLDHSRSASSVPVYPTNNASLGALVQERRRQREQELARQNLDYYEARNRELGAFRNNNSQHR